MNWYTENFYTDYELDLATDYYQVEDPLILTADQIQEALDDAEDRGINN